MITKMTTRENDLFNKIFFERGDTFRKKELSLKRIMQLIKITLCMFFSLSAVIFLGAHLFPDELKISIYSAHFELYPLLVLVLFWVFLYFFEKNIGIFSRFYR